MRALLTITSLVFAGFLFAQDGWIQRTSLPVSGRHRATGCSIGNKGYVGLGHVNGLTATINYADWWEYDPASDSWTQKANYPTVNYGAVCFTASGKAFVGGGAFLSGEFYAYSPLTNTWTAIPNCPNMPGDQQAMSVNNKGYVVVANLLYEFDPATNIWTQKANAPVSFAGWCIAFSNGASGYVKSGSGLYEYKPLNNQWVVRASFPGVNTNGGAVFMQNGRAYVVSGFVGSLNNVTSEVWEYNPGNNTWQRMADFPGSARRFSVAFTVNDRGYFGTGTHGINLNDFWELQEPVGVDEVIAQTSVKVFPQPANEFVSFDLTAEFNGKEMTVELRNLQGAIVKEVMTDNGRCTIERGELSSGMYIYTVRENDKQIANGKILFN
jgi:N-acetylneuraminic acid mutarotase